MDGPKHDFLPRNGTNGHDQRRSVPSGSTRSNRVETRPYYYYSLPYFRPLIPTTLFIGLHVSFYLKIALDFGRGRELLMRLF